jgi:hypothetical protein
MALTDALGSAFLPSQLAFGIIRSVARSLGRSVARSGGLEGFCWRAQSSMMIIPSRFPNEFAVRRVLGGPQPGQPQMPNISGPAHHTFPGEQFHAQSWPNNAITLSRIEWLWSPKRA